MPRDRNDIKQLVELRTISSDLFDEIFLENNRDNTPSQNQDTTYDELATKFPHPITAKEVDELETRFTTLNSFNKDDTVGFERQKNQLQAMINAVNRSSEQRALNTKQELNVKFKTGLIARAIEIITGRVDGKITTEVKRKPNPIAAAAAAAAESKAPPPPPPLKRQDGMNDISSSKQSESPTTVATAPHPPKEAPNPPIAELGVRSSMPRTAPPQVPTKEPIEETTIDQGNSRRGRRFKPEELASLTETNALAQKAQAIGAEIPEGWKADPKAPDGKRPKTPPRKGQER